MQQKENIKRLTTQNLIFAGLNWNGFMMHHWPENASNDYPSLSKSRSLSPIFDFIFRNPSVTLDSTDFIPPLLLRGILGKHLRYAPSWSGLPDGLHSKHFPLEHFSQYLPHPLRVNVGKHLRRELNLSDFVDSWHSRHLPSSEHLSQRFPHVRFRCFGFVWHPDQGHFEHFVRFLPNRVIVKDFQPARHSVQSPDSVQFAQPRLHTRAPVWFPHWLLKRMYLHGMQIASWQASDHFISFRAKPLSQAMHLPSSLKTEQFFGCSSLHMLFIHPPKGPLRLLLPPRLWDSTTTTKTTNARSNATKNVFMLRLLRMERMNQERVPRLAFNKEP